MSLTARAEVHDPIYVITNLSYVTSLIPFVHQIHDFSGTFGEALVPTLSTHGLFLLIFKAVPTYLALQS